MSQNLSRPRGLAVVGVAFDQETPALIASSVALAQRTGSALRFVHVLQASIPETWILDLPLYNVSSELIIRAREELVAERKKEMDDLLAKLPREISATGAILGGDTPPAIIRDAEEHGANMILVAANRDDYAALLSTQFSVAMRLMAEAPMPVLVTSSNQPLSFASRRFSILCADDLQPGAEEAARKAFEFAAVLGECRVRQLHVHGDFREILRDSWRNLVAKHPSLLVVGDSPEKVLAAEFDARVNALKARAPMQRNAAMGRGVAFELDVRSGDVVENIKAEIDDVNPDLIVFGRHRTLKTKPYLIGRVGLRTMLETKRPILVVPPHEDLYAPMPFPVRLKD